MTPRAEGKGELDISLPTPCGSIGKLESLHRQPDDVEFSRRQERRSRRSLRKTDACLSGGEGSSTLSPVLPCISTVLVGAHCHHSCEDLKDSSLGAHRPIIRSLSSALDRQSPADTPEL
jgi:hypothetical protein